MISFISLLTLNMKLDNFFRGNSSIDTNIVARLSTMLDELNAHAKCFRMARDRLKQQPVQELKLQLIFDRHKDGIIYNTPIISK